MHLLQDNANTVILTLTESTTLTADTPFYLFEFSSPLNTSVYFTAQDISTNIARYNRFTITLTGGTQNLTGGTVTMQPDGRWNYNIYQQESRTNLSLTGVTGSAIESGWAHVSGNSLSQITSTYTGGTYTYSYYKG